MSRDLKALRNAIPTIAADGSNPIRTAITKERWEDVQLQYTTYVEEVATLSFSRTYEIKWYLFEDAAH